MTEIRRATTSDIPALLRLGKAMHAESPRFSQFEWDEGRACAMFERLLAWDQAFLVVAERTDPIHGTRTVVGGLAGACMEHWFSRDLWAQDFAIFVDPTARGAMVGARLIVAFKDWALARGAKRPQIGVMAEIQVAETGRMLERLGFRFVGPVYEWDANDVR